MRARLLKDTVAIAELDLGEDFLEENHGRLWGMVTARPYMRTKLRFAEALERAGRTAEAIAEYEDLLELDNDDHQGVRDNLLPLYFMQGDPRGARLLLEQYGPDSSALFQWSSVFERYFSGDLSGAAAALESARESNPHVETFLNGGEDLPQELPDYYTEGEASEAAYCAHQIGPVWRANESAVKWLRSQRPLGAAAAAFTS